MTDHDLSDLLDRLGERAPVGPPPTAAMLAAATRARRRRTTWAAVGSTAAVLAVTIGGVTLLGDSSDPARQGPADPTPTSIVMPPGTRLVGLGHAAIAVPKDWRTNELRCGTPQQDTVIIDQGVICAAHFPRPEGVDSVHVYDGWYGGFGQQGEVETESFVIDGEPAERVATTCPPEYNGTSVCSGAVYLPEADVTFLADSSSQDSRAKVDEILSWIRVLPDLVGVPGFQDSNIRDHAEVSSGDHYLTALEMLGLRVEVVTETDRAREEGHILDVSPKPGTMVAPGSVVTVTEVAAPD